MSKRVWIGVAVAAVLLVAAVALYFMFKTGHDRSYHDGALTPVPNVSQTQISQPPPSQATDAVKPPFNETVGVVKPPFNASAYEVNYTLMLTATFSGVTVTIEAWSVIGVGPAGNYSFGMITVPLVGTATYKSATEDDAMYTMTCFRGECDVKEEEWPFTSLIDGINVTRTAVGQCRHLNYTGTLYEERGMLDPKALPSIMRGFSGNYTAYVCEVNGVVLSADLVATASAHGETIRLTMKMEAVKAGPYRPDTYRLILKEIKTHK